MSRHRDSRINEELRKEIADIIFREIKDPDLGFVSVVRVDTAHDLRTAKVYYSAMGTEEENKLTDKAMTRCSGFIRREVAHRLNLRNTPELTFIQDGSIEHGIRIAKILEDDKKLHPYSEETENNDQEYEQ